MKLSVDVLESYTPMNVCTVLGYVLCQLLLSSESLPYVYDELICEVCPTALTV
jgi:hypothetical protein